LTPHLAVRPARLLTVLAVGAALVAVPAVASPPASSAATSTRPLGIDVSRWQSAGPNATCAAKGVDWRKVATTSRDFSFIRASYTGRSTGAVTQDPCFDRNWAAATDAGLYRGAYHYAVPSKKAGDAVRSARAFVAITGRMQAPGDLPPVLDLEVTGGLKPEQLVAWTRSWLTAVRSLTGRQPIIYSFPSFWRSAMADSAAFHAYPLWIAHWTAKPSVPGGWPAYTFHQYAATGRVAGIAGEVDLNVFNGSAAGLRAMAHPGTHPTASPSSTVAYRGQPWSISGHLRTTSGQPVTNASVKLYRRVGTGGWLQIAVTRTTSRSAAYRFTVQPTAAARYKVRYSGGTAFAASWSYERGHDIRDRATTRLTAAASSTRVGAGRPVRIAGRLVAGATGSPLVRRSIMLQQRVGSGPWTTASTVRTSAKSASYSVTVRPRRATSYRAVYRGSLGTRPDSSAVVTVRIR
jgi:GH25 family lysozyme M1 (1,4-beta-N-acetylmuramidase)